MTGLDKGKSVCDRRQEHRKNHEVDHQLDPFLAHDNIHLIMSIFT